MSTGSVLLRSSDGQIFTVEKETAYVSVTLKLQLEDADTMTDPIPLPNISSDALVKVIDYCKMHAGAVVSQEEINEFDANFVKVDREMLAKLTLAATYLGIDSLVHLTGKSIAEMLRGKRPEEIRQEFDLPNDLTEDQVNEIRATDAWVFQ